MQCRDFPGGPVVGCLPCNAGDMVSWSGNWDPKCSRATRPACHKLSLYATTRESVHHNERSHMMQTRSWVLQLRPDTAKEINLKKSNMDSWTGSRNRKKMWGENLWNLNKTLHIDSNNNVSVLIIGSLIQTLKETGCVCVYIYICVCVCVCVCEVENVLVYISCF